MARYTTFDAVETEAVNSEEASARLWLRGEDTWLTVEYRPAIGFDYWHGARPITRGRAIALFIDELRSHGWVSTNRTDG